MIINQIFSNFILEDCLNIDTVSLKEKIKLEKSNIESRQMSNIGGWQSTDIDIKTLSIELEKEILKNSLVAFSYLGLKELQPRVYNSWININHKHDFNDRHLHKESILSGVYYISTNVSSGNIVFFNPNDKLSFFISKNIIDKFNSVNSSTWQYEPKDNMLLLFPSWIEHQVMPNLSDNERISIAFNVGI